MAVSFWFICAVAFLSKVSMQARVEGVTGGSVILPCPTNSKVELITEEIIVRWRQNDDKVVCDIIKGNCSSSGQDPEFKSRVETFPDEYKNGNYSLKLTNLTRADGGKYQCFMPHLSDPVTIHLIVNESKARNEKQSTAHTKVHPTAENETKEEETPTKRTLPAVLCVGMLCVLCVICVAVILWKRSAKTSGSGISVPGGLSCGDSKSEPANINHQDYSVLQTKA